MLRLARDWHRAAWPRSSRAALACAGAWLFAAFVAGCGPGSSGPGVAYGREGSGAGIEQRDLSDRPPLAIIERQGDPQAAVGFASLASGSPALHAQLGQLLMQRLRVAGFETQLVAHGLGFELTLLAEGPARAREAARALLRALQQPVGPAEVGRLPAMPERQEAAPSAVSLCSAELPSAPRARDASNLERERVATFAQDRSALSVVGDASCAGGVADALEAGPDWPQRGPALAILPKQSTTQVVRAERPTLSLALTVSDPNRALGAAARLGESDSALAPRLLSLGAGFELRRVTATAHPRGACLRIDSEVDASPLPDPRRLAFALRVMEQEARTALALGSDGQRLEMAALSATDPRAAARAAAYHALVAPAESPGGARLVALMTPDEGPLAPALEAALQRALREPAAVPTQVKVEAGQHGIWALVASPCAAAAEQSDTAGHAALFLAAASERATRGVRLEPWIGTSGLGLVGFAQRRPNESEAQAAQRLADALGHALVAPPSATVAAGVRSELVKAAGGAPHPLLERLLEVLAPGHLGALLPRGSLTSLQSATRDALLTRQRELLRAPHRLVVLSPSDAATGTQLATQLGRWLQVPDAGRSSPCSTEISAPARGELALASDDDEAPEGSYLAFRVPAKAGLEAAVLAEILNLPDGLLARALAEPELVGAARAQVFGTTSARALVVQVGAFAGHESDALARVQKLFERLAAGGTLSASDIDAAVRRLENRRRLAALDPRNRLVQLLEGPPAPVDAAALRRLTSLLRPQAAVVARSAGSASPQSAR